MKLKMVDATAYPERVIRSFRTLTTEEAASLKPGDGVWYRCADGSSRPLMVMSTRALNGRTVLSLEYAPLCAFEEGCLDNLLVPMKRSEAGE